MLPQRQRPRLSKIQKDTPGSEYESILVFIILNAIAPHGTDRVKRQKGLNQQPMKLQQLNKTNLTPLILGILVLSSSFVIKRYTFLSDAGDGFLKGISIGLLLQSVILIFQQRRRQAES